MRLLGLDSSGPYLKGRDLTSHAERGFRKRSASPRALDQGAHCTSSSEPDIQNSAAGCKSSLVNLRFYTYSSLAPSCYNRCNRRIRPILNSWQLVPNTNELRFLKSLTVNHLFQTRTLFVLQKMTATTELTQDQIRFFVDNGFIVLKNIFTPSETQELQKWAQEVHDLPRTSEVPWMPYEVNHFSMALPWTRID